MLGVPNYTITELSSGLTPVQISRELMRVEIVLEKLRGNTHPLN
jgi:hypothetical protein